MHVFLHALSLLFRCLPRGAAQAAGAALGFLWYHLIPVRRSVARANLHRAFPDKPARERRKIARACYRHLARSAIEFLRLPGLTPVKAARLVEHEGWDHLERALGKGRGVIIATAHFGNFDLMACVEALRGVPLHIITREQSQRGVNRFWMRVRARFGLGFLAARDSALKIHRLLREAKVVAMVIDQHMPPGRGLAVPFFGHLASTTHAPALLALHTGAPILPASVERLPGGRHRVQIDTPIEVRRGSDRPDEVLRITRALNDWLETRIRACPDQWLWIHRRWKLGDMHAETPAPSV